MKESLKKGLSMTRRITVDAERSVDLLGPGLEVYATPSMVRDIEIVSHDLIVEHLEAGEESVGTHISVDHLGATPLGMSVDITVSVVEVDGRRLRLDAEVRDEIEQVGRGRHDRFVVDIEKQKARLEAKLAKARES